MRKSSYWRGSAIRTAKKRGGYADMKVWAETSRCPKCGAKLVQGRAMCSLCGWDKE